MKNGNTTSAMQAAQLPSYVIDASPTGVYPADYEELVKQARARWIAVLAWRGMLPANESARVSGGSVA